MSKSCLILLLLVCANAKSQNVGLGTTAPTNKLHIASNTDPLRIEGLQSGAVTDSFVTVNAQGVVKKRAITLGAVGWSVTGNSGISPASNFLGTLDNTALIIKTNNQRSGFIEPDSSKRNNAIGNRSLNVLTTGVANNAFGYMALSKVNTGSNNIAIGDSALTNITFGSNNVGMGTDALGATVTGTGNVAVGNGALKNNVASENIAIGNLASNLNTTGSNVLAIGASALLNNQTGFTHLAIGNNALQQITSGIENLAVGYNTGLSLTAASYNVLVGHYALSAATTATNNTVVGHNAGLAFTGTGNTNNTFIGYQSALSQTGGTGNTFVGYSVDLAGTASVNNSSALGQGVQITANNQVRVGNTSVTSIGGQVGWTTFSDARIKTNVREDIPGLSFIMKLRPVSYNYDVAKLRQLQGSKSTDENASSFSTTKFSGLLAQEVEQAATAVQYDFSGVDKPTNDHTVYGLRYAEFVVPLIKAVQEMKTLVDQQQAEIDRLKKLIENK